MPKAKSPQYCEVRLVKGKEKLYLPSSYYGLWAVTPCKASLEGRCDYQCFGGTYRLVFML
jgi:hypothetical protein